MSKNDIFEEIFVICPPFTVIISISNGRYIFDENISNVVKGHPY